MPESMSDQIAGDDKRKAGGTVDADVQIGGAEKSPGMVGETIDAFNLIASGDKSLAKAGETVDAAAAAPASTGAGITSPESESSPTKAQQVEGIIKEKTGRRESLDAVRAKAIRNALILLSAAVAFFILTTMWNSRGQPLDLASVWSISLLICCCCFFWACFLKVAMGAGKLFIYLTYGLLLAGVAHYAFGSKIGMVSVHFVTHLAALSVGYTFAEHWVNTAKKNDIPMPKYGQQANKAQLFLLRMYFVAVTICAALGVLWIVYHADDYEENALLLYLLMPLLGVLILWISYVDVSLDCTFLGQGGMALVFAYYGVIMMMFMLSLITLGNTAAAITTWIAILGISGFFGFSLSICNSCR